MNIKGRILAIDYGRKRTGLAATDEWQMIASGLTTVATKDLKDFLKEYIQKETVVQVIIGLPKRLNNELSEVAKDIEQFVQWFQKEYTELPIQTIDERFTSKMATQSMITGGLKKKQRQNKALVDEIAATILLQDFLQYYT